MSVYKIKKGTAIPSLRAVIKDSAGTPINLTGTTVTFRMRLASGPAGVYAVNRVMAFTTNGSDGSVEIFFTALETAVVGSYMGEFVINWAGSLQIVPNDDYAQIAIVETL